MRTWNSGYCAGDSSPAGRAAYGATHGFTVSAAGTWDDAYSTWTQAAAGYTGWLVPQRLTPPDTDHLTVIAPGLLLDGGGAGNLTALRTAATGGDLGHWRTVGRQALAGGWNSRATVFRIGHEMNGTWYPWGTGGADPTAGGYFAAAFRYAVDGIRKHCPLVRFDLCFSAGYHGDGTTLESHYPGDEHVDIVGLDLYDGFATGQVARSPAEFLRAQGPIGFASVAAFAAEHGKRFALDEWGLNGNEPGHDNPLFIGQILESLVGLDSRYPGIVSHDCFFDSDSGGAGSWAANPRAAAHYRALWTS